MLLCMPRIRMPYYTHICFAPLPLRRQATRYEDEDEPSRIGRARHAEPRDRALFRLGIPYSAVVCPRCVARPACVAERSLPSLRDAMRVRLDACLSWARMRRAFPSGERTAYSLHCKQ
jgi:hypothetical protein